MKELSIEEKAKRYDEALEHAKTLYENANGMILKKWVEQVFPELKKSEDESIIRDIRVVLESSATRIFKENGQMPVWYDRAVAWLEKQGEQKPADKVEPKFHEGEWITNGDYIWKIVNVTDLDYILQSQDGHIVYDTISHVDEHFHLWTIKDAKDGDVLIGSGNVKYSNGIKYERIYLFNNFGNAYFTLTKFSNNREEYNIDVNVNYPDNTVPATKEQKEILFMVVKEAGYEWDAEKKELKKIEQKPAWSEEDVKMIETLIAIFEVNYPNGLYKINPIGTTNMQGIYSSEIIKFLKSLKNRVQPQPKQEWSEEDEYKYNTILHHLDLRKEKYKKECNQEEQDRYQCLYDWFKSIKERYTRKPSDEQMEALREAVFEMGKSTSRCSIEEFHGIESLYQDLKKLKG